MDNGTGTYVFAGMGLLAVFRQVASFAHRLLIERKRKGENSNQRSHFVPSSTDDRCADDIWCGQSGTQIAAGSMSAKN
jgi:hypothetical protein